ncbi:hypothetical protein OBBRIDRAFT_454707 [Obba rivulosa]|uniref:Uncharacterized protein n=1 Tax=Obba rivulosa TaxID=1052685 RepID=A0A8E2DIS2_9APHY|nr:hypothetical protein OBBRIDRAFT_454707 [Obba rivulosa]
MSLTLRRNLTVDMDPVPGGRLFALLWWFTSITTVNLALVWGLFSLLSNLAVTLLSVSPIALLTMEYPFKPLPPLEDFTMPQAVGAIFIVVFVFQILPLLHWVIKWTVHITLLRIGSLFSDGEAQKVRRLMRQTQRRNTKYKRTLSVTKKKQVATHSRTVSLKVQVATLFSKNASLLSETDSLRSDTAALQADKAALISASAQLQAKFDALRKREDRLNQAWMYQHSENKTHCARITTLELEKAELVMDRIALRSRATCLDSANKDLRAERDTSREDTQALRTQLESLHLENETLRSERDNLEAHSNFPESVLRAERDELQSLLDASNQERDVLQLRLGASNIDRNHLQLRLNASDAERKRLDAANMACGNLWSLLDASRMERDDLKSRLDAASMERDNLKSHLDAASMERDDLKSRLDAASMERDNLLTYLKASNTEHDDLRWHLHDGLLARLNTSLSNPETARAQSSFEPRNITLEVQTTELDQQQDKVWYHYVKLGIDNIVLSLRIRQQQRLQRRETASVASHPQIVGADPSGPEPPPSPTAQAGFETDADTNEHTADTELIAADREDGHEAMTHSEDTSAQREYLNPASSSWSARSQSSHSALPTGRQVLDYRH